MPDPGSRGATGRRYASSAALAIFLTCVGAVATLAGDAARVTQKGRAFTPGMIGLQSGDRIEIVNDDGELVHHAYLDNPDFSFDIGEQGPGSKASIAFPKPGKFTVLCGIHPKMKLIVTVK